MAIAVHFLLFGFYWRTKSGVKNSTKINRKMLNGLRAFKEDYPEARAFLLYRGNERRLINNILCLPCEQFLRDLIPGQPVGGGIVG